MHKPTEFWCLCRACFYQRHAPFFCGSKCPVDEGFPKVKLASFFELLRKQQKKTEGSPAVLGAHSVFYITLIGGTSRDFLRPLGILGLTTFVLPLVLYLCVWFYASGLWAWMDTERKR